MTILTRYRYHFTEQLRFKHLYIGELFMFPPHPGRDYVLGPFKKISPRKYVPCETWLRGVNIRHRICGDPILIGSINTAVSDQVIP